MGIEFSRRLAVLGGILAPLGETVRRWSTWRRGGVWSVRRFAW